MESWDTRAHDGLYLVDEVKLLICFLKILYGVELFYHFCTKATGDFSKDEFFEPNEFFLPFPKSIKVERMVDYVG